jgi:hypothetical protein
VSESKFADDRAALRGRYLIKQTTPCSFEENDFFSFTQTAGGYGLIPDQRIIETITTPLPAAAAMFAVAMGLLGWFTRRA